MYINTCTLYDASGPCMTLVLSKGETGEGVIDDFRQLIGPADVDTAKQEAPTRYWWFPVDCPV